MIIIIINFQKLKNISLRESQNDLYWVTVKIIQSKHLFIQYSFSLIN